MDLDVVGIGNALVDVISTEGDDFLAAEGLVKGTMALIDADRATELYAAMGPAVEMSGGGAANTLAGLAGLGGRGGFVGRVGDDQLGAVFAHDIRAIGVEPHLSPATDGAPTGRCLILVTPDAERTMSTFLGAASGLGPDDVDEAVIARAAVTYLEGFLLDGEANHAAFDKAAVAAHRAGGRVALTLSDVFCVERSHDAFLGLVESTVDILFANEDELRALYRTDDVDMALAEASLRCDLVALTRGPHGCTIAAGSERVDEPAAAVSAVLDTTGAGDLFAAGFLRGLTSGHDLRTCARLGNLAAGEVISHPGARPEVDLADLAAHLLLAP